MNRFLASVVLFFCFFNSTSLLGIGVSVTTAKFQNEQGPYVEIYSRINANSVQWVSDSIDLKLTSSTLEYLVLIYQEEKIVLAEKYNINSNSQLGPVDFWDLKRFGLENGNYKIKLQFVDLNNSRDTFHFESRLNMNFTNDKTTHSDVLFLSKVENNSSDLPFAKASFKYEPMAYNLFDYNATQLIFYTELYNSNLTFDETYFVKYYVENTNAEGFDAYFKTGYKKLNPNAFEGLLIDFDARLLRSGNYILHVELNKKDRTFVQEFSERFSVYNPLEDYKQDYEGDGAFETSFVQFLDANELNYGLKAISPRVGNNMTELLNQIIANDDLKPKRYYLYNFWSAFSIDDSKKVYDQYMNVAKAVDATYANNVGRGFETHRGYYFLKYGKPDDVIFVEDEPTAPPYEIWIYNYLEETQQTNVRFLFYNPSLATNDFYLLHSTCRGERNNPRWELELYSAAYLDQPNNSIGAGQMPDGFNRNARKIFETF